MATVHGHAFCLMIGSVNSILSNSFKWVFIPIVMTGLDQDMMQNLSCKSLLEAQKICIGMVLPYTR